jgi:hypothetical protein
MRRLLALIPMTLALFLGVEALLTAQAAAVAAARPRVVTQYVGAPVEERLLDLPEDGDVWHTSLFVHPNWQAVPAERRLVAAFETEPRLVSLKAQTKYHLYTTDDPIYRDRFASAVPVIPSLVLQRSDGEVIYKSSGDRVADDPHALGHAIKDTIRKQCPDGRCRPIVPRPQPEPVPQPEPIPDLGPPVPEEPNHLLPILIAAAGLATGVGAQWKKDG